MQDLSTNKIYFTNRKSSIDSNLDYFAKIAYSITMLKNLVKCLRCYQYNFGKNIRILDILELYFVFNCRMVDFVVMLNNAA